MAIFSDGTQAFGIPDSPVTINSVTYIAEDIKRNNPAAVVEIKDPNGLPIGQTIIPGNFTLTAKLQLASGSTAIPTTGLTFTLQTIMWYVTTVGQSYTQGQYTYVDISAVHKLN